MDPGILFRHVGAPMQAILRDTLRTMLESRDQQEIVGHCAKRVDLLFEAEQFEILYEEMLNVIEDSLAKQQSWNQFPLIKEPFKTNWAPRDAKPDVPAETANGKHSTDSILYWSNQFTGKKFDPYVVITGVTKRVGCLSYGIPGRGEAGIRNSGSSERRPHERITVKDASRSLNER